MVNCYADGRGAEVKYCTRSGALAIGHLANVRTSECEQRPLTFAPLNLTSESPLRCTLVR